MAKIKLHVCNCPADSPFLWASSLHARSFTPVELRARHSAAATEIVNAKRAQGKDYGQIAGLSKKNQNRMQGNFATKGVQRAKTKAT